MWESVTAEKGHWATLYSNLEVLVHLCNVVGLNALRSLPSVPFDDLAEGMERSHYIVDPTQLKLKFFDKGMILVPGLCGTRIVLYQDCV